MLWQKTIQVKNLSNMKYVGHIFSAVKNRRVPSHAHGLRLRFVNFPPCCPGGIWASGALAKALRQSRLRLSSRNVTLRPQRTAELHATSKSPLVTFCQFMPFFVADTVGERVCSVTSAAQNAVRGMHSSAFHQTGRWAMCAQNCPCAHRSVKPQPGAHGLPHVQHLARA